MPIYIREPLNRNRSYLSIVSTAFLIKSISYGKIDRFGGAGDPSQTRTILV